jgi:hypothetical protein
MPSLFDPLVFLERETRCEVALDDEGVVRLKFDRRHTPENIKKAQAVAKRYDRLLTLQLREGHKSVQKLLALGKIKLVGRRYVLPGATPSP